MSASNNGKVKCLICGAVFDASLEICPVCGVGPEHFESVSGRNSGNFRRDTQEIFMILGGGTAALSAAKAIRARNATGHIVLVSEEDELPYNRPMLTKNLTTGALDSSLAIENEAWYEENEVYPMLGRRVESLDLKEREVYLEGGIRLAYDKLIYALGARCFVPPFKGGDLPEVCAIRSAKDAQRVREMAVAGAKAVVIGGGVLGLEAAWALRQAGMQVTVLETAPMLMAGKLDEEASAFLAQIAADAGVCINANVKVESIEGEEHVSGVSLADGTLIPADFVVVSCGIRANAAIASDAGLHTDRAVKVDARMQTSERRVYACGDCAEYEGMNYGIWPEAVQQGEVAGANAAGEALRYQPETPALTMNALGTSLYAIGSIAQAEGVTVRRTESALKKLFYRDGKLTAAILIGDIHEMSALRDAVARGATRDEEI